MEQVASQCRGGFLRQLLEETTGRLEQGCRIISDAYIHYYYKLRYKQALFNSDEKHYFYKIAIPNTAELFGFIRRYKFSL